MLWLWNYLMLIDFFNDKHDPFHLEVHRFCAKCPRNSGLFPIFLQKSIQIFKLLGTQGILAALYTQLATMEVIVSLIILDIQFKNVFDRICFACEQRQRQYL